MKASREVERKEAGERGFECDGAWRVFQLSYFPTSTEMLAGGSERAGSWLTWEVAASCMVQDRELYHSSCFYRPKPLSLL